MDWVSFFLGLWLGAMAGIVTLAILQMLRERRDDYVAEIEAMRQERSDR